MAVKREATVEHPAQLDDQLFEETPRRRARRAGAARLLARRRPVMLVAAQLEPLAQALVRVDELGQQASSVCLERSQQLRAQPVRSDERLAVGDARVIIRVHTLHVRAAGVRGHHPAAELNGAGV